ncbi:MAG: tetratricopeptide repeat protein, partial [Desulfuromonadales bacterium]|nr:tetratricopeptide repeat protein [Desulfuromonadales bacterium]NIS42343.1 tetratricopeptide repeat protein [Desulfuromonadales bacterium]
RAQSAYRQGDYAQARLLLGEGSGAGMTERFRARARYLLAWSYLEEDRFEEAKEQLQRLSGETPRQLSAKLPAFAGLPRKSPKLAGGLSAVLPGAGQLYVGRPRDASLAFLLNAAFILGIVESFDDGNEVVGAILLFFEGGWYTGNIFNAANGAHKYNRDVRQEFLDDLRPRFGVGLDLDEDQARLQLQL